MTLCLLMMVGCGDGGGSTADPSTTDAAVVIDGALTADAAPIRDAELTTDAGLLLDGGPALRRLTREDQRLP